MAKKVQFKTNKHPTGQTEDLVIRICPAENGFIIKAGGAPYICDDAHALQDAIKDVLSRFIEETQE